jgi:hypothetical protein
MKKITLLVLLLIQTVFYAQGTYNFQTLPLEFNNPMDIEFIQPNNVKQMVVGERAGDVYICDYVNGQWIKRPTPIISVNASTYFERGLTALAVLDENGIIVSYALEEDEYNNEIGANSRLTVNRVSRFPINVSNNTSQSEVILLEVPSIAGNHQGLALVEKDGYVFVSIGDGAGGVYLQQAVEDGLIDQANADVFSLMRPQTLNNNPFGKIMRIDAIDGSAFTDNPFYEGDGDNWNSKIWHIGLRNTFDMCLDLDGNIILGEVGAGDREEISIGSTTTGGMNFGWGLYEGFNFVGFTSIVNPFTGEIYSLDQPTDFSISSELSERLYTHKLPSLDYGHNGNEITRLPSFTNGEVTPIVDSNGIEGNSVTGGTVIVGDGFGEQFNGAYIFSDFTRGWLNIALKGTGESYFSSVINFADDNTFDSPVDITQGFDGEIYVVNLFGDIDVITYEDTLSVDTIEESTKGMVYHNYNNWLEIKEPVNIYNLSGQLVKAVEESGYLNISEGFYLAVDSNRNTIKIVK